MRLKIIISILLALSLSTCASTSIDNEFRHWPDCLDNSGPNATAILNVDPSVVLPKGIVGVFDSSGLCIGQAISSGNTKVFALKIAGNDVLPADTGAEIGEQLSVRFYADFPATISVVDPNGTPIDMTYKEDGVYVIKSLSFGNSSAASDSLISANALLTASINSIRAERDQLVSDLSSMTLNKSTWKTIANKNASQRDSLQTRIDNAIIDLTQ